MAGGAIILNKVDELSKEELDKVKAIIRRLQPKAEIIETNYSKVSVDKILNTNAFDFDEVSMSAAWIEELNKDEEEEEEGETEEYGIGTFVYTRRAPLDRDEFDKFASAFPANIIRCKGVIWFGLVFRDPLHSGKLMPCCAELTICAPCDLPGRNENN